MIERLPVDAATAGPIATRVRAMVPRTGRRARGGGRDHRLDRATRGDDALRMHERRFGGGEGDLRVSEDELAAALEALDPAVRAGLEVAIANVEAVARAGVGEDRTVTLPQGHTVRCASCRSRAPPSTRPAGATRTRPRS